MSLKNYCNDFTIKVHLGGMATIQTTGSLIGIHASKPAEAKTQLVAPETHEQIKQYYVPESALTGAVVAISDLLTRSQCETAVKVKDQETGETTLTVLDKEDLDDIKKSDLPKNIMSCTVHDKYAADAVMYPAKDGQSYVFYPNTKDPDNLQAYNLLSQVIAQSDLAFCAEVNLQNHEGLFRLEFWRGRLALVRQGYPDTINEHEAPGDDEFPAVPDKMVEKAIKGFAKLTTPLDPTTYHDRMLQEKLDLQAGGTVKTTVAKKSVSNLEAMLAAFGDDDD